MDAALKFRNGLILAAALFGVAACGADMGSYVFHGLSIDPVVMSAPIIQAPGLPLRTIMARPREAIPAPA